MKSPAAVMDEDWKLLLSFFPKDWEVLAREHRALKGLRKNKSAGDLLRTLLIHLGCGCSLRETVLRARRADLAELSDVALLKRLRKSGPWLYALCRGLFQERMGQAPLGEEGSMILLDASLVAEPGKTGSQWRLHYGLRWPALSCEFFSLSPAEGKGNGESFLRFPVVRGAHYLADRGYSTPAGIRYVAQAGGLLAVRLNPNGVRLCHPGGRPFPLREKLRAMERPGQVSQWAVLIADSQGEPAASGRLCVLRKSQQAAALAQRKLRRKAQKNGTQLLAETLEYAGFVMVFTTFEPKRFASARVLEWYRLRWQIELVFKRFKQIADLGHLPKHDAESSRAWLYGKLLVALLTEKLMASAQSFSPWGYDLQRLAEPQPVA